MTKDALQVEHREAVVNGVRLQYVEKAPPGAPTAPVVVLLHGFPETWWSWRHQIEPLVAAGYRVIAPDQRGYADSGKNGPFDIDTLAADIAALIAHVAPPGGKALLVGHDWGGGVAWHVAAHHPERVARLVVMNCPHPVMMMRALTGRWSQIKKSWYIFFFLLPMLPERLLTQNGGAWVKKIFRGSAIDRTHFTSAELAPILEAVQRPGAAHGMVSWYRAMIRRGITHRRALREYPRIGAPTLLLWALDDIALGFDDLVPGTERLVPGLRVETIAQCGHFVQQEQPEKANRALLAFLAEGATEPAMKPTAPRARPPHGH
ncbi:MAG: alpha/beta hydrolase [Polyangiales bacterium]